MLRTVVLLHRLPDGSSHYDWMLEQPDQDPLATFRCTASPHVADTWTAERLPDHRRVYLEYEGPVSRNRGDVRRVAAGVVLKVDLAADLPRATCDFGNGVLHCEATELMEARFTFRARRD